jgi:hypothetical protein
VRYRAVVCVGLCAAVAVVAGDIFALCQAAWEDPAPARVHLTKPAVETKPDFGAPPGTRTRTMKVDDPDVNHREASPKHARALLLRTTQVPEPPG